VVHHDRSGLCAPSRERRRLLKLSWLCSPSERRDAERRRAQAVRTRFDIENATRGALRNDDAGAVLAEADGALLTGPGKMHHRRLVFQKRTLECDGISGIRDRWLDRNELATHDG